MSQPIAESGPSPADEALRAHDAYLQRKYLPELDGLRAISILIVVSVHMKQPVWDWLSGWLGVTIFFVLSGYLITRLALIEERAKGHLSLRAFFIRRVFRLFPLYYLTLGVYVVLILGLRRYPEREATFRGALPYYLTYLQEWPFFLGGKWGWDNISFMQTWTLGIEEKFYLVWPIVCFVLWRHHPRARLWGTPILAVVTATAPLWLGQEAGRFLFPYAQILLGCWIALILDDPVLFHRASRAVERGWRPAAILAGVLVLHFTHVLIPTDWEQPHRVVYSVFVGLALVALLIVGGPLARFLGWAPLVFLGRLSYAIYLVHLLLINVVNRLIPPSQPGFPRAVAALLLTCLLSTVVAWILHLAVERPCIALGRRLSREILRRDDRPASAVVAGSTPTP